MVGVCSWSLRPASPADLVAALHAVGLRAVQLALGPLRAGAWPVDETARRLADAGIAVRSGMLSTRGEDYGSPASIRRTGGVRSDEHWTENLRNARSEAEIARRLGLPLVTFHAGFLPESRSDPERGRMLDRLRSLVDVFASCGVRVAFETGQETAATLLDVLAELSRPLAGVNFDPANMLLYDMGDPIDALTRLLPRVRQVHVKDALRPTAPGTWGREVPVGHGQVDWETFFAVLRRDDLPRDLMIEREAGDDRVADIRAARDLVRRLHPVERVAP